MLQHVDDGLSPQRNKQARFQRRKTRTWTKRVFCRFCSGFCVSFCVIVSTKVANCVCLNRCLWTWHSGILIFALMSPQSYTNFPHQTKFYCFFLSRKFFPFQLRWPWKWALIFRFWYKSFLMISSENLCAVIIDDVIFLINLINIIIHSSSSGNLSFFTLSTALVIVKRESFFHCKKINGDGN